MRIIHEIHSADGFQGTIGGDLYRGGVGRERIYQGWRAEILIVTKDPLTGREEPIHIEGAAQDVRRVLGRVLEMLDAAEEEMQKKFESVK